MRLPFSLTAPVSRQHHQDQNKPLDTLKMQLGLEQLGFLEPGGDDVYTSTASDGLFNAMKDFQSATDLKVDGIANPGGPTEAALNRSLVQAPAKPILSAPIADAAPGVRYKNERSLPSLDNHTDPGDLPMLMAGTLLSEDGDKAAPEVADLLRQTFERDQDMGLKMRNNLAEVLDPADMAKMDEAANIPAEARKAPETAPWAESPAIGDREAASEDKSRLDNWRHSSKEDDRCKEYSEAAIRFRIREDELKADISHRHAEISKKDAKIEELFHPLGRTGPRVSPRGGPGFFVDLKAE